MSENTTPNPCGSTGSWVQRPSHVRPPGTPTRQDRRARPNHRQEPATQSRGTRPSSSGQESDRSGNRRLKWFKVATGFVKQRHARRFGSVARQPRGRIYSTVHRRQPRDQASLNNVERRRIQVMAEDAQNRQNTIITQITSLETLRHELESRMAGVLQALSTAVDDPSNAMPRIAAAADAQVVVMKKLVLLLRRIDDSGLIDD